MVEIVFNRNCVYQTAYEISACLVGSEMCIRDRRVAYTKEDLDWMDKNSRSSVEMGNRKIRPEIEDADINLKEYDRILLGFPIWWYVAPTIVNTFLETHDFSGKEIILFATSGGSGFGHTVRELQPSAPGAVMKEGKLWNRADREAMKEWIDTL